MKMKFNIFTMAVDFALNFMSGPKKNFFAVKRKQVFFVGLNQLWLRYLFSDCKN